MKAKLFLLLGVSTIPAWGGVDSIFSSGFEPQFTVGGEITGLTALSETINISLNGEPQITADMDGTFVLNDYVEAGQTYVVGIDNANCTVMNESGIMPYQNVTDIAIDCPLDFTTVYDIKQGIVTGDVALQNMLVTVCKDNFGYNLQTVPMDVDYQGDDYSGIFVYDNQIDCTVLQPGDRVDINPATVALFFGEVQLNDATFAIQSSNNPLPTPIQTTTAALNVTDPHPLNAVLVEIQNATVTGLNSPEYEVDASLTINNLHHVTAPFPEIGESMSYIRGPLRYHFSLNKIAPRSTSDLGRDFKLIINEVDYDQPTSDDEEFIEIYNLGPGQADLTNIDIVLVSGDGNGSGNVYHSESLASIGTLGAGEYLVYGDPNVISQLPNGVPNISIPLAVTIQNSGPEGIALVNTADEVLLDALSYEGEISSVDVGFTNPVNLVEGTATLEADNSAVGSMSRIPNGQDTDDASLDWVYSDFSTPGTTNVTELPIEQLLINEVDYDQLMTDNDEFVELYNPSPANIDLSEVDLVMVNGSLASEYDRITLNGTLGPGEYAVIGSNTLIATLPVGVVSFAFDAASNNLQNGSPDAVAIINNVNNTLIDSLSYEGSVTAANITGFPNPVNLVDGTATNAIDTGAGSIIRNPNGQNTGDDNVDFVNSANPTPGASNN